VLQSRSHHGSPILPTADAQVGATQDLVYDPVRGTLRVDPVEPEFALPLAGFNDATGYGANGSETTSAVLLGITPDPMLADERPRPGFAGRFMFLDDRGDPVPCSDGAFVIPLANVRWGGTITRFGTSSNQALVWGGNVDERTDMGWFAAAGEIVASGGCASQVVIGGAAAMMPEPTAFHTATLFQGHVVLGGGLLVDGIAGDALQGFATSFLVPPVSILRPTGSDPQFAVVPLMGTLPTTGRIFHTATVMPRAVAYDAEGEPTAFEDVLMLVGGASAGLRRMEPIGELTTIKFDGVNFNVVPVFSSAPASPLIERRWGHAATPLPNGRLLITGGLRVNDVGDQLRTLSAAEVFAIDDLPPPITECEVEPIDAGPALPDAGLPDTGPPVMPDTGLGAVDAGM
jgi:hypothetical protein